MAGNAKTNFELLVQQTENREILLPDFQRQFVWRDEEQQRKLVASVLTKMPLGSILLLESPPDDYASKKIGCKNQIDTSDLKHEVKFLLDGQQRITVLSNVFSNVILDNVTKINDLIAPAALKRRFFLKIPKWSLCKEENDHFGVKKLTFPLQKPDVEIPKFLSNDILSYITTYTFSVNDKKPYNPNVKLSPNLDNFCISDDEEAYLFPLFLLVPTGDDKNIQKITLRRNSIIASIAKSIGSEIIAEWTGAAQNKKDEILNLVFPDKEDQDEITEDFTMFDIKIQEKQVLWSDAFTKYVESCIKQMELSQIIVSSSERGRAIDIYENLNRGGVSLNTFDLIMARVAKESKKNFHERITNCIKSDKKYPEGVLPTNIKMSLKPLLDSTTEKYNASMRVGSYNQDKNEINSRFIDVFLDVMGLYCINPGLDPDIFKIDHIKRNSILDLDPKAINKNCEKVLNAIDRALYFFQTRCGIRSWNEINYSLMVVLVATVFLEDSYYYQQSVHDLLDGWYWSVVFSGEYDKDQNVNMINNLKEMMKTLNGVRKAGWIDGIKKNVLAMPNFSDKQIVLLEKAEEKIPKAIIRGFVVQYLLSKTYPDMFDDKKIISVFCSEASKLEAHHIIPLGSVTNYKESTDSLRQNKEHICNSPVNFVLITSDANKTISSKSLDEYIKSITDTAKSKLNLTSYTSLNVVSDDTKVRNFLDSRFDWLLGDIKGHIGNMISIWL